MRATVYNIQVLQVDHPDWVDALRGALSTEVRKLGLHRSVEVSITPDPPTSDPSVVVYLGSPRAATDASCVASATAAVADLRVVVPVVDDLVDYSAVVPDALRAINGWQWTGPEAPTRLARLLLEELGIEERQRSVFISHKREDGLLAAEQLYEHLSKHGFDPFVDRFDIRAGADVQTAIADALETRAFLLLLETPLAHTSPWVFDEVEYALAHSMGLHIITWPGSPDEVPGSNRLPRQILDTNDLQPFKGFEVLTDDALDRTHSEIEAAHISALVRRRRYLLRSVEDAAESKGLSCTALPGWRLLIGGSGRNDVVAVSSRLPEVADLWQLDDARRAIAVGAPGAVLVHAARIIRDERRALLDWASGGRPLTLVPENAIGGYW